VSTGAGAIRLHAWKQMVSAVASARNRRMRAIGEFYLILTPAVCLSYSR
jgi:uncharacterized protein YjeT (DUF2065 family)